MQPARGGYPDFSDLPDQPGENIFRPAHILDYGSVVGLFLTPYHRAGPRIALFAVAALWRCGQALQVRL